MQKLFFENCTKNIKKEILSKWYDKVYQLYTSENRHYHSLVHVQSLLNLYQEYQSLIENKQVMILSIFFHDVIYDPKKGDNEEKSNELFQQFASETNLNQSVITKVSEFILATKRKKLFNSNQSLNDENQYENDLKLFLDFDWSILGSDEQTYEQYSKAVHLEYNHLGELYKQKRLAFLGIALQKLTNDKLYLTDFGKKQFLKNSIKNVQNEIKVLSN
ncbi:hypothetical protein M0812_06843 [Anaeramoeba flamelloides]|uniref:HD domain-containing protein n=1 Tax=Anaeramoeba flamelloides TaxID=1746091 RepID=A0AAV8A8U3_9EUKA|nr:hypothetical protein M0812_06843 [Anaeramoeba flamelloides]